MGGVGAVRSIARRLLNVNKVITADDAEAIAREEAERRGWPWHGRIRVTEHLRTFVVRTNTDMRGGNVTIAINLASGEVRRSGYAPR